MAGAIVQDGFGPPDVLALADVDDPVIDDGELLVRVRAAAVNPYDWHFMEGTPYVVRTMAGFRRPKLPARGVDFAGEATAVGAGVTRFRPGDTVFGECDGAFGEYARVREDGCVQPMPSNLTFEQAAAVPMAGMTALQGLRDKGKLRSGQKVLVNGASGGIGTFAVRDRKLVPMFTAARTEDLAALGELLEAGTIAPVIDRTYSLSEVPDAIAYAMKGHARGKVVIATWGL